MKQDRVEIGFSLKSPIETEIPFQGHEYRQQQTLLSIKSCEEQVYVLKMIISVLVKLTVPPLQCFLGTTHT